MPICFCAIGCQHSTFNRLFGCVFLVWRHHLRKVNKSSVHTFRRFFLQFCYLLMFFNIQIDWIILKTYDQQFTLTTKKSLHIIFKEKLKCSRSLANRLVWFVRANVISWAKKTFIWFACHRRSEVVEHWPCCHVTRLLWQPNVPWQMYLMALHDK